MTDPIMTKTLTPFETWQAFGVHPKAHIDREGKFDFDGFAKAVQANDRPLGDWFENVLIAGVRDQQARKAAGA